MASKLNGSGKRACESWIDAFIAHTDNLEAPVPFRRWAAISVISAALEQKVWLRTSSNLYPNTYIFIVGHPGVGKTRTIRVARNYYAELADPRLAPTSFTGASLIDAMVASKRTIIRMPEPPIEYNTLYATPDEIGTLLPEYDKDMIPILTSFYDIDPYGQKRRGKDIDIKIKHPQLNFLAGSTPSNLLKLIPELAWDQGFTSRIMMIFSDERIIGDDFATVKKDKSEELIHDLKIINDLIGEFSVTGEYRTAVNNWRALGEPGAPNHPKLLHYNTRRRAHLYKLSMVAAVDRSNVLTLTKDDFNRAMGWMTAAEADMHEIFKAGAPGADGKAMDEIMHYVSLNQGQYGLAEHKIVRFARERIPAHSVMRVLDIMQRANMIKAVFLDKRTGTRMFKVMIEDQQGLGE